MDLVHSEACSLIIACTMSTLIFSLFVQVVAIFAVTVTASVSVAVDIS